MNRIMQKFSDSEVLSRSHVHNLLWMALAGAVIQKVSYLCRNCVKNIMADNQQIYMQLLSLGPEAMSYMFPGVSICLPLQDADCIVPPPAACIMPEGRRKRTISRHHSRAVGSLPDNACMEISCTSALYDSEPEYCEDYSEAEASRDDEKARKILEAIGRIQKEYGISIEELEIILSYKVKLSHLVISPRGKITLPDFDYAEVKMDLLSKAVFLLFLRHPEGIEFKNMPSYRRELRDIYYQITNRDNNEAIEHSLDLLCNPVESNSLNEKVSRIKRAFTNVMDERIARAYYIDGPAGGIRKISLDRALVRWE